MGNLPIYVSLLFFCTAIVGVLMFLRAAYFSRRFTWVVLGWLILQSALGLCGFYKVVDAFPPRFPFLLLPPVLSIIVVFGTKKGRAFIDRLDLKVLTLFHIVRLPVEVVLMLLCTYKAVPQLLTFEGRNFDILSGITAPIVFIIAFAGGRVKRTLLVVWNIACLLLLLNIVYYAVGSVPGPLQHFAFSQPNIALFYFPFNLLPSVLVPLVLFAHLAALRQLLVRGH